MRLHLAAEFLESAPPNSGTYKMMIEHAGKDGANVFELIDQCFLCGASFVFMGGFDDKENSTCRTIL